MEWRKEIGRRAGVGGWKEDLPLDELPEPIVLVCSKLEMPIHPMFAVRIRVFMDWHSSRGRSVEFIPPENRQAREALEAMNVSAAAVLQEDDAVVPVTKICEFAEVEEVANRTQQILEYELPDVSALGQATFMAVSELCGNAIEHGSNSLGGTWPCGESKSRGGRFRSQSPTLESEFRSISGRGIPNGVTTAGRSLTPPTST